MTQSTYKPFVDRMITRYEGGYGWNKKDTGGPTKYGITCYDLAEHRGQRMDSMSRWAPFVQAMTLTEAEEIYASKYAAGLRYNDLPAGPDVTIFDYGVNSGVSRPIHSVRAILGLPGGAIMDDALVAAIKATDPAKLIHAINSERLQFMHSIRGGSAWAEFGGGWQKRVDDLNSYAGHLLVAGATAPSAPDLTKVSLPKANHGDPTAAGRIIKQTSGGAIATGAGSHTAGLPPWIVAVGMGIVVIGGALAIIYERQKSLALNVAVTPPVTLKAA